MNLRSLIILLVLISSVSVQKGWSQDAEFSQFYAAPAHLNPAMIGFANEPRVVMNYRHQYASFGNAYLTLGASYDQHFSKYNSSIGISLLGDVTGGGLYNNYNASVLYAYQLRFTDKLLLKIGTQVSYLQQSLNWNSLVFGDMIDPLSGEASIATEEELPLRTNLHRLDLGLGLMAYTPNFYIGASFKHITQPNLSFTSDNDPSNRLAVRSSFHLGKVFYMGPQILGKTKFYVSPNLLFINQGQFFQTNAGVYLGKGFIYGGMWYRHTISNSDALILLLGVKAGIVKVGYSYDFNVAAINTNAGTHELSLIIDWGNTKWASKKRRRSKEAECPEIFRQ